MDNIKISATFKLPMATQSMSMTKEAYTYMMNNTPGGTPNNNHRKLLSENQRIAEHLSCIQHDLGATGFDFVVFRD